MSNACECGRKSALIYGSDAVQRCAYCHRGRYHPKEEVVSITKDEIGRASGIYRKVQQMSSIALDRMHKAVDDREYRYWEGYKDGIAELLEEID